MGLLDGLRILDDRTEVDLVAVVLGLLSSPDGLHGLDPLTHQTEATGRVGAVVGHLLQVPSGTDPEQEPAVRQDVDRGNLLSGVDRVPLDDQGDASSQFEAIGDRCPRGKAGERVEGVVVHLGEVVAAGPRRLPVDGDVAVFGQPQ